MNRCGPAGVVRTLFLFLVVTVCVPAVVAQDTNGDASKQDNEFEPYADRKEKGIRGHGLTAEEVNRAIKRGRTFLWNHYRDEVLGGDVSTMDENEWSPLVALALVHSKAHEKDPEFRKALNDYLRSDRLRKIRGTYQLSLLCMLIDAYGNPEFFPLLSRLSQRIVNGQARDGLWKYQCPRNPDKSEPGSGRTIKVYGDLPPSDQDGNDVIRPRMAPAKSGHDFSITQFAVLALRAAEKRGFTVSDKIWRRIYQRYQEGMRRNKGGWGYKPNKQPSGSMTSAGVCSLTIAGYYLGKKDPRTHSDVVRGLKWLNDHFTVTEHPKSDDEYHYYYVYSLERTGRIIDHPFIGEHEWYPIGAKYLVGAQRNDGSWKGKRGHGQEDKRSVATSYALLFLTRATKRLKLSKKERQKRRQQPATLATGVTDIPQNNVLVVLDASGSMRDKMNDRTKFDVAREAVLDLAKALPKNVHFGVRVYGHQKFAVQEGADTDTKLEIPMKPLDLKKLETRLNQLRPKGKTPLTYSLRQAKKDLSSADGETTVVLLTDGRESDPRKNPVDAAKEIAGSNVRFCVIGFDVGNKTSVTKQLKTMSQVSNGSYWPANKAEKLAGQIQQAVILKPKPFTLTNVETGKTVARDVPFGTTIEVSGGTYRLETTFTEKPFKRTFRVGGGSSVRVVFDGREVLSAGDKSVKNE